jgi:two-component system chemotaxis response regulator CheY
MALVTGSLKGPFSLRREKVAIRLLVHRRSQILRHPLGLTRYSGQFATLSAATRPAALGEHCGACGCGASIVCGALSMAVDLSMPILVVDDYQTMTRIIRNLLKQLGFTQIDDANDGMAALKRLRERQYGLIISDWNMQPMTGYELLKEVRANPDIAATPFIMITAESKTENVIAAKQAGVNNYIVKPFNAQTLKAKIDAVFP